MAIARTAVVGAGTMGSGIAHAFSSIDMPVLLKDVDPAQIHIARKQISTIYQHEVERGRISPAEYHRKLSHITYTLTYDGFDQVDLVIEAVPENLPLKQRIFAELDQLCPPHTILASNTSALSITALAHATSRPKQVIGMHFFNPVHRMKLVEIIPTSETDPAVTETIRQLAIALGKIPVTVRESPGFLVNRLLMSYLDEAILCVQEGTVFPSEIDRMMGRDGIGWPMGPFALMDLIGNDVCYQIISYLASHFNSRITVPPLLRSLVELGRLGKKTSAGWYDYPGPTESLVVRELIEQHLPSSPSPIPFTPDRPMMRLLNEAALCAQEEIATPQDIDLACVNGLSMQIKQHSNTYLHIGPLEYMDRLGLDHVLSTLEALEETLGPRFHPAEILREKVAKRELGLSTGRGFHPYPSQPKEEQSL